MDYDDPLKPKRDFERVLELGVFSEIITLEDYEREVTKGTADFRKEFRNHVGEISPEMVREAHALVFGTVHPWAGNFRTLGQPGDEVLVGGKFLAIDAPLVESALERLWDEQIKVLVKDPTFEEKCGIIAKFHCEFENIHPFADGNGRIGRFLLEHQMNVAFGERNWANLDGKEYKNALNDGNKLKYETMAGLIKTLVTTARSYENALEPPFKIKI